MALRYFCGLATTPKQQMTLIVEFFNTCFTKNKAAARDGKHTVTFVECQEIAKRVLAANKVYRWNVTRVVEIIRAIIASLSLVSADNVLHQLLLW